MARDFTAASSMDAKVSAAIATAAPLTMACWYRPVSGISSTLMCIAASASTNSFIIECANNGTNGDYNAIATAAGVNGSANSGATANNPSVWHAIVGVFTSATSRNIWVGGAAGTANATNLTPASLNQYVIGSRDRNGSRARFANGGLGKCAIWNVALTTDELAAHARGVSPLRIRRTALLHYADNCDQNLVGANSLTLANSPPLREGPPVEDDARFW